MKLIISAFCATILCSSFSFAEECEKKKCDKEEATVVAHCGKCKKHDEKEKKEEGTLLAEDCKKKKCDKDEETLLADCKKCDKDKKKEELIAA